MKLNPIFRRLTSVFRLEKPLSQFSLSSFAGARRAEHGAVKGVIVHTANVPCASCRVCCTQGNVILDLRVDHLFDYKTDTVLGPTGTTLYRLRHNPDGSCIYLDPETKACTTYDTRPSMCRTFDCRKFAGMSDAQIVRIFERAEDGFRVRAAGQWAHERGKGGDRC